MNKRGQIALVIIAAIIVVSVLIYAIVDWRLGKKTDKEETIDNGIEEPEANITPTTPQEPETNTTEPEVNDTGNETTGNESVGNETELPSNPTGILDWMEERNDVSGGYFCDNNTNPTHVARLYTYKTINGIKNFSESYIESGEISSICSSYDDRGGGMKYDIRWLWDAVESVEGYRLYQYYLLNNTERDYNFYIDIQAGTLRFTDTGLRSWKLYRE